MNESPICFGAGKNQSGSFKVPSNGTLASVKLVHVDGYVRCNGGNPKRSFWGCIQDPTNEVNVEIKAADTVILPSKEFLVTKGGGKRSLEIPGYNSLLQSWCCRPTSPILQKSLKDSGYVYRSEKIHCLPIKKNRVVMFMLAFQKRRPDSTYSIACL